MGGSLVWEVIGVIDTEGDCAEWSFPAEPGAVRGARAVVRGQLCDWGLDVLGDITALLVSELVTNSLRYATGPIGVRLVRPVGGVATLLVEVSDPLPDPPRERTASPEEEGGRGLQLVAHSSSRWGTRPARAGKTVWFELSVPG
jgi:anti-sigma regulatory factor (Ser/Thr protein kinase)